MRTTGSTAPAEPSLWFGGGRTSPARARKAAPEIDLVPLRAERRGVEAAPRPHIRRWLDSFLLE